MKKIILIFFLTLSFAGFSQRVADQVIKMNSKIEDLIQNSITGVFVVKEGNVVKGISPDTKVEVWSFDADKEIGKATALETLSKAEQDSMYAANRQNGNSVFSGKVQSDNYLKFLVNELKPFIDKNFSTNKTLSSTFIAGSSIPAYSEKSAASRPRFGSPGKR